MGRHYLDPKTMIEGIIEFIGEILLEGMGCLISDGMGWIGAHVIRLVTWGRVDSDPDYWFPKFVGVVTVLLIAFSIAALIRMNWSDAV